MRTLVFSKENLYNGDLILVNQRLAYRGHMEQFLVPVTDKHPEMRLERRAVSRLSEAMQRLDGWRLITPVSAWRSLQEQRDIYAQSLRENGRAFTQSFVALPGHSEHQTGLAIDFGLTQPDMDFIRPYFPYTGICQGFRRQAAVYGFIERYTQAKRSITGIAQEPWHFRYVGSPHAEIMAAKGMALEEYHGYVKQFSRNCKPLAWQTDSLSYRIFYVEAEQGKATAIAVFDEDAYTVSGDNENGFILTTWRRLDGEQ